MGPAKVKPTITESSGPPNACPSVYQNYPSGTSITLSFYSSRNGPLHTRSLYYLGVFVVED